jgi:hypothetical protein
MQAPGMPASVRRARSPTIEQQYSSGEAQEAAEFKDNFGARNGKTSPGWTT